MNRETLYSIASGGSITRWWVSELGKKPYEAPMATFDEPINQEEGYVQIVYPIREKFLKEPPIYTASPNASECKRLYFPFEGNRVDFSTFLNTPHYLWVHAATTLRVEQAGDYSFDLYTCGGVRLWVNGSEQTLFVPYTRNIAAKCHLTLPLHKGDNQLVLYADELAERDVFFYFELRYTGNDMLATVLEVPGSGEVERAEAFLQSCSFVQDVFCDDPVTLCYDPGTLSGGEVLSIDGLGARHNMTLNAEGDTLVLGNPEAYPAGMHKVTLCREVAGQRIERRMMVGLLPPSARPQAYYKTIAERKQVALQYIANHAETHVNRALAVLELGGSLEDALACIEQSLGMIERHADCADFYLPPMLLLLERFGAKLAPYLVQRIEAAVLHFRYWMDEPGNDVMWFFSENHALLFHISQYLAGHRYPNQVFTASGRSGREQYTLAKHRIEQWFDHFLVHGYAEWNSATYIPVDLIGFFSLYLMAPDESVCGLAKQGLDYTFGVFDLNTFYGVMAASYGRAYEETIKGYRLCEPSFFSWISCNVGNFTPGSRAATLYALSDYEPPQERNRVQVGHSQWCSVEWDQGIAGVKTYSYRTGDYLMACARRYRPFSHGHQQHLMHIALGFEAAPFCLNHPGERLFSGENRPAYWAGNGTKPLIEQYRNLMLLDYRIAQDEVVPMIHAYAPLALYDAYCCKEQWFFARSGNGYLGVWFQNGYRVTVSGANANRELIAPGRDQLVLARCASSAEFGDFDTFINTMESYTPEGTPGGLAFADPLYGSVTYGRNELFLNGNALPYHPAPNPVVTRGFISLPISIGQHRENG